ncbi:7421_t:CDS:2 [Funneliformis caledonium]|uniref:7421_t:CDS:1 n=1 Tax=Funneliformis caledonium TaxID=1117310 RepID=A0A9N9G6U4_9GLOM|nr:7421_t:CDS:2 [Funneliformis caledonium]
MDQSEFRKKEQFIIEKDKVLVELFVMSRCPDAVECEAIMAEVAKEVNDISTFKTNYIATLNSSATYGATCKHGDLECKGNIQELCFHKAIPNDLIFFNYLLCTHRSLNLIGSHKWAKQCSEEVGQDYGPIDECVNSDIGLNLFIESVKRAKDYQANKSCTIFINGKKRCIKDGSWYDCPKGHSVKDFINSIKNA